MVVTMLCLVGTTLLMVRSYVRRACTSCVHALTKGVFIMTGQRGTWDKLLEKARNDV